MDRVDVARLLREVRGSSPMSGTMSGNVALASRGTSSEDVVRAAHGSGRVTIADGDDPWSRRWCDRSCWRSASHPAHRLPAPGSSFTKLEGNFALADQTLRVPDITFASRDFDMTGNAIVRFPAGALDVHANVMLSPS